MKMMKNKKLYNNEIKLITKEKMINNRLKQQLKD